MATSISSDLAQSSLQIKQDDKFYCRLLSKESSRANPSLRIYYGGASCEVPFMWESRPGTPKNTIATTTLPPLTPPPSSKSKTKKADLKKLSKPKLLSTILPKLTLRKTSAPSSPTISMPSSPVSSVHSGFSPMRRTSNPNGSSRVSSTSLSLSSMEDDKDYDKGSPTSILCFGTGNGMAGGLGGSYKMVGVKNVLMAIVGHGSRHGVA